MPEINYPYTHIHLTEEVIRHPNMYGRLQELNLFPAEGIASTLVEVGLSGGRIVILGAEERGAAGSVGTNDAETSVIMKVPHFPHDETIKPADLQDRFVFGTGRQQLRSVDTETANKLLAIRNIHAITLEFLRMGALKGLIIDGKGVALHDLYALFGITKKTVDFKLGTADTDIFAKCDEVVVHIRQNLFGDVSNGVHCLVGRTFFRRLITHPKVEQFYKNHQQAVAHAQGHIDQFVHGGITWEAYDAIAPDMTGGMKSFVEAGEGHAFPLGTTKTFKTVLSPPDHVDFANTMGVEVFVSPKVLDHGKGVELHSESNPLPFCNNPAVLVDITSSD